MGENGQGKVGNNTAQGPNRLTPGTGRLTLAVPASRFGLTAKVDGSVFKGLSAKQNGYGQSANA